MKKNLGRAAQRYSRQPFFQCVIKDAPISQGAWTRVLIALNRVLIRIA